MTLEMCTTDFVALTLEGWAAVGSVVQAAATILAVGVAAIAIPYTRGQVREARRLREEQARPFVTVDFESSSVSRNTINLVIENIGKTLARNVRVTFDPPLESSQASHGRHYDLENSVLLSRGIPTMPPGKRIEALFDLSHERIKTDLPMTYTVRVESQDSQERDQEPLEYVLDLNFRYGLACIEAKTVHDVAKSLKGIEHNTSRWTQHFDGLRVWVRDEDRYLEGQRHANEE